MKTKVILSAFAALAIAFTTPAFEVQAQSIGGGPGIAMVGSANISQLPDKAKSFIDKHFKDIAVKTCEKYFAKGKYEVELVNGIDLDFNTQGEVIEIDAPDNAVLSPTVVKEILPHKAYSRLEQSGYINSIESIEFKKGKVYEVELKIADPDTYIFSVDGTFIAIED
ncbi:MAG: hypothetical protein HDR88_03320 [Bacteroides sp.]|nr:hypothetical protein [Bacteroides sp.]